MRPTSPVPVLVGIALSILGFLLIAFAWARVAATDGVAFQMPYVISGGLTGIGLILVGLTTVAVQSRRIEGSEQSRQIAQVAASVSALREVLLPTDDDTLSVARVDDASADETPGDR